VQEPPQPKIKLRLQAGQETPTASTKKITIHVKDTKGSTTASPGPLTGQSNDSNQSETGGDRRAIGPRLAPAPLAPQHIQLEKARSASTSGQSPSPSYVSARLDAPIQSSPGIQPRMNGTGPLGTPNGTHPAQNAHHQNGSLQNGHSPMVHVPPPPLYDKPFRSPGRGTCRANNSVSGKYVLISFQDSAMLSCKISSSEPFTVFRSRPSGGSG